MGLGTRHVKLQRIFFPRFKFEPIQFAAPFNSFFYKDLYLWYSPVWLSKKVSCLPIAVVFFFFSRFVLVCFSWRLPFIRFLMISRFTRMHQAQGTMQHTRRSDFWLRLRKGKNKRTHNWKKNWNGGDLVYLPSAFCSLRSVSGQLLCHQVNVMVIYGHTYSVQKLERALWDSHTNRIENRGYFIFRVHSWINTINANTI